MKIWEPKPPGTLWATPGLLQDFFPFTFYIASSYCKCSFWIQSPLHNTAGWRAIWLPHSDPAMSQL